MKKLLALLLLLIPSIAYSDTATSLDPHLILITTGTLDRTRSPGDKLNENFSIISATMNYLLNNVGGGGGSQSSFAGSKATGAVEMQGFSVNNSSGFTLGTGGKITFPDGTTQNTASLGGGGSFDTGSTVTITGAWAFNSSTPTFKYGVPGIENRIIIKPGVNPTNRTLWFDRSLALHGWSLQSEVTNTAGDYRDLFLNPLGGDVGIGTTTAIVPLEVNGTVRSKILSDYGLMDYWAFGDSITDGSAATSLANEYPSIIANTLGYNLHNMGVGGVVLEEDGLIDNVYATVVTTQTVSSLLIGYNNSRYYGYDVKRSTMFEASLPAPLVFLSIPETDKYWANHASWTYIGTWAAASSYSQINRSSFSQTAGDIAITTAAGKTVFLTVTSTASGGGDILVTVDGSTYGVYSLTGSLSTYTDARKYAPQTIILDNLTNGPHEIKIKVVKSGYCEINWIAGLQAQRTTGGIGVYVGNALRMTDNQYLVDSPAGSVEANRLYNKAIEKVVKKLAKTGLNVVLVDVESKFNPDKGMMSSDNVHPNDYGHNIIANAFLEKMQKGSVGQEKQGGNFLSGYTPTFSFGLERSSVGASNLFTFDTDNVRLGISSANPSTALVIKNPGNSSIGSLLVIDSVDDDLINLDPNFGLTGNRSSMYLSNAKLNGDIFLRTSQNSAYDQNAIVINGTSDNVGIGTSTPQTSMHIARQSGDAILTLENTGNGNTSGISFLRERSSVGAGAVGGSIFMDSDINTSGAFLYLQAQSLSADAGIKSPLQDNNGARILLMGSSGQISIETGSQERMRINNLGRVSIGTTTAKGFLHLHSSSVLVNEPILFVSSPSGAITFNLMRDSITIGNELFTQKINASSATVYGTITSTSGFVGDGSKLTGITAVAGISLPLPEGSTNYAGYRSTFTHEQSQTFLSSNTITGSIEISSAVMKGFFVFSSGTNNTPGWAFARSTTTGMYLRSGSAFACQNNTDIFQFDTNGLGLSANMRMSFADNGTESSPKIKFNQSNGFYGPTNLGGGIGITNTFSGAEFARFVQAGKFHVGGSTMNHAGIISISTHNPTDSVQFLSMSSEAANNTSYIYDFWSGSFTAKVPILGQVFNSTVSIGIPIANPTAGTYLIKKALYGMNLTRIACIVDPADTGENTVLNLQECDADGDTCTNITAADVTCGNTNTEAGAISNNFIDAGDWFGVKIVSVSGTVSQAVVTLGYQEVRP